MGLFSRRKPNRATGIIDTLPVDQKDTVDQMLLSGCTYREIVEYLADNEVQLSQQSVCRYARKYLANVEQLKMAQDNMRMMMDEMAKYPELDTTEAILRISSQNVFNAISSLPAETWEGVKPDALLKEASALIRAAGYKRQIDHKLQTDTDKAVAANQSLLYDVLARKHPELYKQIMQALASEQDDGVADGQ